MSSQYGRGGGGSWRGAMGRTNRGGGAHLDSASRSSISPNCAGEARRSAASGPLQACWERVCGSEESDLCVLGMTYVC